jgi:hypothetical protein
MNTETSDDTDDLGPLLKAGYPPPGPTAEFEQSLAKKLQREMAVAAWPKRRPVILARIARHWRLAAELAACVVVAVASWQFASRPARPTTVATDPGQASDPTVLAMRDKPYAGSQSDNRFVVTGEILKATTSADLNQLTMDNGRRAGADGPVRRIGGFHDEKMLDPPPPPATFKPIVPAALPKAGLVGLWRGEDNAFDHAGKNHGALKGGATFAPGKTGRAFTFDGKDDHVSMGDVLDWGKGSWSISLWVRKSGSCAKNATLLRKSLTSHGMPSGSGYGLDIVNNRLRFYAAGPNESNPATTVAPGPVAGQWRHVAGVLNRATGKMLLYVDGLAADSASIAKLGSLDTNMPLSMGMLARGHSSSALYHFTGAIDEVAMWNRALSAEEVRGVYTASLLAHPVTVGLVGLWLGDGGGNDHLCKNNGKADQTVTYTVDRYGTAKGAFLFDKSGGHVTVPDCDALDTDTAFTISTWVKSKTNQGHLFVKWGAKMADYSLQLTNDSRVELIVCDVNMRLERLVTDEPLVADRWAHVAATFDRGAMIIYINGKRMAGKTRQRIKSTFGKEYDGDNVTIGGHPTRGAIFTGAIDEPALWNRALSAAEIAQIAKARSLADLLLPMAPYIHRDPLSDRVALSDGKVLKGIVGNEAYELTTFFGKIKVPAKDVIGLAPAGSKLWLMLADGQVLVGEIGETVLRLSLPAGSVLKIPLARIRQCGYRITKAKPANALPSRPMITLQNGQRLALASGATSALHLRTTYATVALPPNGLIRIEPAPGAGGSHRVVLAGGSTLTGTLASQTLKLKLALGPVAAVRRDDILDLTATGKSQAPPYVAVILMRNGDRLVGALAHKVLIVRTEFGPAKVFPISARTIAFDAVKAGTVALKMWGGSTIEGQLAEPVLNFVVAPDGPTIKLKPAHIASITRLYALPGPETLTKAKKLIAQLGAESYTDREAATRELLKMGKGVMPLLKKHANSHDSEIRQRIEGILEQLSPKKPEPATPPNTGRRTGRFMTTD